MKPIHSTHDFADALNAERAVLFLFFGWSRAAQTSRQVVEQWEQHVLSSTGKMDFTIYELSPDDHPETWKWINGLAKNSDDCECAMGSVIWLKKGDVVGLVPNAAQTGGKTLSRITKDCFIHGKNFSASDDAAFQAGPAPFDTELLNILCCPETHQELQLAAPPVLEKLNNDIPAGRIKNRGGQTLSDKIDGGLIRADGKYLYPLQGSIPLLLVDEAIPLC